LGFGSVGVLGLWGIGYEYWVCVDVLNKVGWRLLESNSAIISPLTVFKLGSITGNPEPTILNSEL
jgi:hypothetical protein